MDYYRRSACFYFGEYVDYALGTVDHRIIGLFYSTRE